MKAIIIVLLLILIACIADNCSDNPDNNKEDAKVILKDNQ